jgi:diadenosine tetraphosphate (Ap4A) HIT family hydrolase
MSHLPCPLCGAPGPEVVPVWADARLQVVRVLDAPDFPAFYRVIWSAHVSEFSELPATDRQHCMDAVVAVEQVLRQALQPRKINLAALGNMVPHLHWHVIARFDWDSHFPQPIWGSRQRDPQPAALARLPLLLTDLDELVRRALLA